MEEQDKIHMEVNQMAGQPPVSQPTVQPNEAKSFRRIPVTWEKIIPLILACLAIMTGIGLFVILQKINNNTFVPTPITIVVTPTPSPTPIRNATNISTTSAFLTLQENISKLNTTINEFEKDDPSLSPPSLVLPLGF
jgi:hypothetical protein